MCLARIREIENVYLLLVLLVTAAAVISRQGFAVFQYINTGIQTC